MLALITNSRAPYCFDVPRVLALPNGSAHRFRYYQKWISDDVNVANPPAGPALIVLRDFDTGTLLPIRFVTISKFRRLGDILWIEFVADNYLSSQEKQLLTKAISQRLVEINVRNAALNELKPLVLPINYSGVSIDTFEYNKIESQLWDEVVNEIGRLEVYREYSFYRVAAVTNALGKPIPLLRAPNGETGAFAAKPGALYSIEILQKIPFELDKDERIGAPFLVELSCPDGNISPIRRVERVLGKYDLLQFSFRTANNESRLFSEIHFESKKDPQIGSGELFLKLRFSIRPNWRHRVVTCIQIVALVAGAYVMAYADATWKFLGIGLLAFGVQGSRDLLKKWLEHKIKADAEPAIQADSDASQERA